MNVLNDLPTKICTDLRAAMPALKSCEPHWGKLDLAELKKRGANTPSILVAPQGSREKQHYAGRALVHGLSFSAYILTSERIGSARVAQAAELAAGLLAIVPDNDWALDNVGEAEDVRFHVLDTTEIRNQGIALWAVTWLQPITFFSLDQSGTTELTVHAPKGKDAGSDPDNYTTVGGGS